MWYVDESPNLLMKVIIFIILMIVLWFIGFLIKRKLENISLKQQFEAKNVMKLIISISQLLILAFGASFIFEIQTSTILSVSALLGTALGFALAVVISNIVAGFYLVAVRPFGIGDLIRIGSTEGIVLEIGLNYTKLLQLDKTVVLIPNKTLMNINLINCSIQIKELEERSKMGFEVGYKTLMEDINAINISQSKLTADLAEEITGGKEIVRYPFTLQFKLNIVSPDITLFDVNARMNKLMERWEKRLGYRPRYYYNKYIFRQDVRIILVVDNAKQIIEMQPLFIEELYRSVFVELHGGNE